MVNGRLSPIDVDDRASWPSATRRWAETNAERLAGSTQHVGDLELTWEDENALRLTFGQRKLVGYHCTRLLPSEYDLILAGGLRLLDEALVNERIEHAVEAKALPEDARRHAVEHNVYAAGSYEHRGHRVCLVIGRTIFDQPSNGCDPLLRHWGGEAIRGGPQHVAALESIGAPSIVVAALNLTRRHDDPHSWPALAKLFVGSVLGLPGAVAEVHFPDPIAAKDILAIWQPGDPDYDRHHELPR